MIYYNVLSGEQQLISAYELGKARLIVNIQSTFQDHSSLRLCLYSFNSL